MKKSEIYKLRDGAKLAVFLQVKAVADIEKISGISENAGARKLGPKAFFFSLNSGIEPQNLQEVIKGLLEEDCIYIVKAPKGGTMTLHFLTGPKETGGITVTAKK